MVHKILHVWRNTPFGRETLRETIYFAERVGAEVDLIQPRAPKCLLDLGASQGGELLSLSLDASYLRSPGTARSEAEKLLAKGRLNWSWLGPTGSAAEDLPVYAVDVDYFSCPRVMSDRSTRIGLGQVGASVRHIVHRAPGPVLIPTPVFRPWSRIVAFFGGSAASARATTLAGSVAHAAGVPLTVFSYAKPGDRAGRRELESAFEALRKDLPACDWLVSDSQPLEEALMDVPTDALLVLGAYGHGLIHKHLFGGFAEIVQTVVPAPLFIVGPRAVQHA